MSIPNIKIIGYKIEARFICPLNNPKREPETDYHYFDGVTRDEWSSVTPDTSPVYPPKVFETVEAAKQEVDNWTSLAEAKVQKDDGFTLPHPTIMEAFYSEEFPGEDFRLEFDILPVVEITPVSTESVTFNHK
jgi:hypothetical protein